MLVSPCRGRVDILAGIFNCLREVSRHRGLMGQDHARLSPHSTIDPSQAALGPLRAGPGEDLPVLQ